MSEPGDTTPPAANPDSAGALLRAARQAQGLHVAALATTLKVPPRKLEALENDRYEEFQGATFVRALAKAACRALKIDPAPVLEKLPELDNGALSQLERGLNAPFREKGARRESPELPGSSRAVLLVVVVLLLGTLAFLFWPAEWRLPAWLTSAATQPAAEAPVHINAPPAGQAAASAAASEPAFPPPALPSTGIPNTPPSVVAPAAVHPVAPPPVASASAGTPPVRSPASAPVAAQPAVAASVAAAPGGSLLRLQARAASWVEVVDARSQVLVSRTLAAGESVGFDGALPLRVKIGNVSGTDVIFRGRPVDLAPLNRDNVAKLELK